LANFNLILACPDAEFLDVIGTKILRVFRLAINSHLYGFAVKFIFLQSHATLTVSTVLLQYTVNEKGGKPARNHTPFPWFKKYR
jgi:hypothetical protein